MSNDIIINYTITILALIVSLFAWIAKIKWSNEYKLAKDAEIRAKEAQIEAIRQKAELYESVISQKLIEYSKKTISDLEYLVKEIENSKQVEINKLLTEIKVNEIKFQADNQKRKVIPLLLNLAHEFRTPINAILGFSQLLSFDDCSQNVKVEYIRFIEGSATQMQTILDDIVNYSLTIQKENLDDK